jgi:hypothetical protein
MGVFPVLSRRCKWLGSISHAEQGVWVSRKILSNRSLKSSRSQSPSNLAALDRPVNALVQGTRRIDAGAAWQD